MLHPEQDRVELPKDLSFLSETVHFHTPVLDRPTIEDLAKRRVISVEFDICGKNEIGHDREYYEERDLIFPPPNVTVSEAIHAAKENDWFVRLDCKNKEALDDVCHCAEELIPGSYMLHAYVAELNFGQGGYREDIPLEEIHKLHSSIGYPPLQVSCRGLHSDSMSDYTEEIIEIVELSGIAVVNFNLPDNIPPENDVFVELYEHGRLVEVYTDMIDGRNFGIPVFRTTDNMGEATQRDF